MSLPLLTVPEFFCTLPSTKKKIKFRPFLVKEEKILLMALESEQSEDIQVAVINILNACLLTKLNIEHLPNFDIEYLFLQIRSKSVGEIIELRLLHEACEEYTPSSIEVDKIEVTGIEEANPVIMLTDTLGIKMKFPSMNITQNIKDDLTDGEKLFELINNCVDCVFEEEETYEDFTKEELTQFIERLTNLQFKKIVDFFQNQPVLEHKHTFKCSKCGEDVELTLKGLSSFFT